jgi:beta-phosphoglucomutase
MSSAILFDFDGVIADTPRRNALAWQKAFALVGVSISQLDYFRMEGQGPDSISRNFCEKHGLDFSHASDLVHQKEQMMKDFGPISIYPEVLPLLAQLESMGIARALVTGASRARIQTSLPPQMAKLFNVVITSDDVVETKPSPEPYLSAARMLGADPTRSYVVENAPLGIQSAKAGGFYCFALETTLPASELAGADLIVKDHAEFLAKLQGILNLE